MILSSILGYFYHHKNLEGTEFLKKQEMNGEFNSES